MSTVAPTNGPDRLEVALLEEEGARLLAPRRSTARLIPFLLGGGAIGVVLFIVLLVIFGVFDLYVEGGIIGWEWFPISVLIASCTASVVGLMIDETGVERIPAPEPPWRIEVTDEGAVRTLCRGETVEERPYDPEEEVAALEYIVATRADVADRNRRWNDDAIEAARAARRREEDIARLRRAAVG